MMDSLVAPIFIIFSCIFFRTDLAINGFRSAQEYLQSQHRSTTTMPMSNFSFACLPHLRHFRVFLEAMTGNPLLSLPRKIFVV